MKMRNFITSYFAIVVMIIFLQHHLVASLSPIQQKTALFQFKQSLNISTPTDCLYFDYYIRDYYKIPSYPKTMNWSMNSDYCTWEGVTCDHKTGDVVGLDLSCSQLEGAILPNNTLFQLSHLRSLNLSNNDFSLSNQFPLEFGFFAKGLTHLNLSYTRSSGRVPSGISHLCKLVSLDLNYNDNAKLEDGMFKSLLQNTTQLRVLNLYGVNISSVLPTNLSSSLEVLNLGQTGLYGESSGISHLYKLVSLDLSNNAKLEDEVFKTLLQNLTQLRVLNLEFVNISSVLPLNLSTSLTFLNLRYTGLHGVVPQEVFHLPNLEFLDLGGFSGLLEAVLPRVKWGSSATLQHLLLYGVNFHHGGIPDSIGFLESLARLDLRYCNLSGPIPRSIGNLGQLTYLGLGGNNLNGPIPTHLANVTNLGYNNLTGPLPSFFAHFKGLVELDLSNNYLSGALDLKMFSRLQSLEYLSLSHNSLSLRNTSMVTLSPKLYHLDLSSCHMKEFPHFSRDAKVSLDYVDLSNNDIDGEIPHWIGSGVWYLNISHNRLTGGLEQLPWNSIQYIDLQSNNLNGSLPTSVCNASSLEVLNLSHNNISGTLPICRTNMTSLSVFDVRMNSIQGNIPANLSKFLNLQTLNLHGNKLEGGIPSSFSNFGLLETLDLGSNHINDTFPQCLEALPNLQVLVLKSNHFHGLVHKSSKIEHPFPSLRIIDLSHNEFSGPLPAMYIKNFEAMMKSDVNKVKATYMGIDTVIVGFYSYSTALVIKGVEVELVRILTVLTTIDLSRNNFEGKIPECIGNLVSLRYLNLSGNHLTGHIPSSLGKLLMLESLDLSVNQLEGEIPQQLASVYTLARLNLSCNQLEGQIPKGSQFNTFDNDSYVGNLGLCGFPLSKECEHDSEPQKEDEDDDYFFNGFTWEAVVIGYGCGVVPAFIIGNLMLLARKPKWFAGIIARELGLKIRRMEIKFR